MIEIRDQSGAVLHRVDADTLRGADLSGAVLRRAYLRGADLRGAKFEGTVLEAADLFAADLREARFNDANLCSANLQAADLREARFAMTTFRGAHLTCADLSAAYLSGQNLESNCLVWTRWHDAQLVGTVFRRADLLGADFAGADLRGADFRRARLHGADLGEADLRGARLALAQFDPSTRWGAGFFGTLRMAGVLPVRGAILWGAIAGGLLALGLLAWYPWWFSLLTALFAVMPSVLLLGFLYSRYLRTSADRFVLATSNMLRCMVLTQRAELLRQRGENHRADEDARLLTDIFAHMIERKPNSIYGYAGRAKALHMLGSYDQAIATYDEALERFEDEAVLYTSRAESYLELGEYERALEDCETAIRIECERWHDSGYETRPDLVAENGYLTRGRIYAKSGDVQAALADFSRILDWVETREADIGKTVDSRYGQVYLLRAEVYDALGQAEKATQDREKAKLVNPLIDLGTGG